MLRRLLTAALTYFSLALPLWAQQTQVQWGYLAGFPSQIQFKVGPTWFPIGTFDGVTFTPISGGGSGTVTSVGASFTGGLVSISGSPVTVAGTLGFTVAGTSGGIPYFSSASTWASSGALTANAIVLGGGAGAAPTSLGSLGTTTTVLHGNAAGAPTFGAVSLTADVTGNLPVTNLNSGTSASGATFWRGDGTWATPAGAGTVTSVAQSFTGGLISVSGSPITGSGTLALTVAGTSGGVPYFSSGTAWASSAALTNNALMTGGGAGAAPKVLASLGTTTTVLHGNAAGAPTFGAVSLTADVTGTLPTGNLPVATAANVQAGTSTTTVVSPAALSGSAAAQTLTDGATINWDMASGYNAKITLTASGHTFAAPTNVIEGLTYTLQLDVGAGPYTVNWNAAFNWGAAGTPTISAVASDVDVISCIARATNNLLCTISQGF